MYNPVNNTVLDKERLEVYDAKQKDKKRRFEIKHKMNNYYRFKNIENDLVKEENLKNKLAYLRYKTTDERGYDIMNHNNNYHNYKNSLKLRHEKDGWDYVVSKAGNNQNIDIKGIYKDPYDFTDNEKTAHYYKVARNSTV